jgi:hypothetical protein
VNGPDAQLIAWIAQGLEGDDRYSVMEVVDGLATGRFQLFRYPQGIVITQITGHGRLLVFLLAGSEFGQWKADTTRDLKAFAQFHGITVVEAYARPGLRKILKPEGWKHRQDVLRLDLA